MRSVGEMEAECLKHKRFEGLREEEDLVRVCQSCKKAKEVALGLCLRSLARQQQLSATAG